MKILAIDDEKNSLNVLKNAILDALPYCTLDCFLVAKEAIEKASTTKYDIVFSDIMMPEVDGLVLAKALKKTNPRINIIFVTGYDNYLGDAINIHASGYLFKPVLKEDITEAINNLLYPIDTKKPKVYVETFGHFEVYVNSEIVHFSRSKAKELLAYLVDRKGSSVTKKELMAILFDDDYSRQAQDYFSKIVQSLVKTLKEQGIENILVKKFNSYAINREMFTCDSYEYLKGNPKAINKFSGEYMHQYSWGEDAKIKFYE